MGEELKDASKDIAIDAANNIDVCRNGNMDMYDNVADKMNTDTILKQENDINIQEFYEKIVKLRMKHGVGIENMGCKIVNLGPGRAIVEMEIDDLHMNPLGSVHGGMIFFLADCAGGTAAFTRGSIAVTSNASIHFVNAARNVKKLVAEAVEIKAGKNLLTYDIYIRTVEGKIIAKATTEYSSLHIPI